MAAAAVCRSGRGYSLGSTSRHAGTTLAGDQVVTSGGRVLCVTALGDTVKIAQKRAYEVADSVTFEGMQMRRDIGWRAIKR